MGDVLCREMPHYKAIYYTSSTPTGRSHVVNIILCEIEPRMKIHEHVKNRIMTRINWY